MTSQLQRLRSILGVFPRVEYAFAYGSGVHYQPGLYAANDVLHSTQPDTSPISKLGLAKKAQACSAQRMEASGGQGPVLDFIFAVHDAQEWHGQMDRNGRRREDLVVVISFASVLNALVCGVAEAVGVGVHFNTLVQLDAQTTIKYGVVQMGTLQEDLQAWSHLYIAGRMQKPITPLTPPLSPAAPLAAAQHANLQGALSAALLLLAPQQCFTTHQLLEAIVALSYRGDVRQCFAEDPRKVSRIVDGSMQGLTEMYLPLMQRYQDTELEVQGLPWLPPSPDQDLPPSSTSRGANSSTDSRHRPQLASSDSSTSPHASPASSTFLSASSSSTYISTSSTSTKGSGTTPGREMSLGELAAAYAAARAQRQACAAPDFEWRMSASPAAQRLLLSQLPAALLAEMALRVGLSVPHAHCEPGTRTAAEVVDAIMHGGVPLQALTRDTLAAIVRRSSAWQAVAGLLTAGSGKAARYVSAKIAKAWHSGPSSSK